MTTAYALVAPLRLGEEAKRAVRQLGVGRPDLRVGRREGFLLIPLQRPIEPPVPGTTVEVAEFVSTKPPRSYKDVLQVPEKYRDQLPTSFDIVGDLVLIKIPDAIRVFGPAIGAAILKVHKNVKAVFHDNGVQGEHRIRSLSLLSGENRTRTQHAEFSARFEVDLAKAYFSPRLANEHDRVARAVQKGEIVVDATAGVGPFSVLIGRARQAQQVYAVDLNPDAIPFLQENIHINRVESQVKILQGDAVQLLPTLAPFDRAIVNLPHGGEAILSQAVRHVKPDGVVHYYRIGRREEMEAWLSALLASLAREVGRTVSLLDLHVVHSYSPEDRLFAVDLRVA